MRLSGRHALVTGGGRGIGRAVAASLTAAGARVTVLGRGAAALEEVVESSDADGFVAADVIDASAVQEALDAAAAARGPVDILVANAGGADSASFLKTSDDEFRHAFELNVMGVIHSVRAVLPGMIERGFGRIIVVASTAGLKGYGYVSAYVAAKHAVVGLVRALAIENARAGVTINAVCPSYTDTPMLRDSITDTARKSGRTTEDITRAMLSGKPLGRLVKPDEVAGAILYLCGEDAAAVTGTTLAIAGGEL